MLVGDTAAPLLHCQPLVFSFFRQQLLHFTPAGCSFTAALTAALIYTLQSVQLEQLINKRRVHFIAYCRLYPVECKHYLCPVNCISIYLSTGCFPAICKSESEKHTLHWWLEGLKTFFPHSTNWE